MIAIREALEAAEQLYKEGVLATSAEDWDRVHRLRREALALLNAAQDDELVKRLEALAALRGKQPDGLAFEAAALRIATQEARIRELEERLAPREGTAT